MSAKKTKKVKTTPSSVCRVNKNANYTVMSNYHLRSTNLSLKAIGLLSKVLSLPENWDYSISGLTAICKEKETAIKAALDELKHWGYLNVTKLMPNETNSGRIEYYVQIPKDLNDIKEKFIMGFTKRQVICFGIGLVLGAPVFFLTKTAIGMSGAIFAMGAVAAPAILCGLYKKNGVFLEKQAKYMREYFTRPRKRYYRTTNIFECFERHIEYTRIKKKLRDAERKG